MVTPAPTIAGLASTYASLLAGPEQWDGLWLCVAVAVALGLLVALIDVASRRVSE